MHFARRIIGQFPFLLRDLWLILHITDGRSAAVYGELCAFNGRLQCVRLTSFRDMLQELSYVQDMPLPEGYVQNKKRLRNTDTTDSLDGPSMTSNFRMSSDTFAQVVSSTAQPFPTQTPDSWSMDDTALPMYSSELGRLPIHPGDVHSTVIPQQGNLLHPSPVHGYTKEGPPLIDGDPQLNTFLENSMHGGQRAFDTVITFDVDPGSGPFTVDYVDTQNSHRASNDLLRAPLPESVDIWSSAPAGFRQVLTFYLSGDRRSLLTTWSFDSQFRGMGSIYRRYGWTRPVCDIGARF